MARTREQWVARWRASGMSGTAFAEQHGLKPSTLYEWGRKSTEQARPEPSFAEVRVTGEEQARPESGRLEIVAKSGRVVVVHGDVVVEQLARVLEAVERC